MCIELLGQKCVCLTLWGYLAESELLINEDQHLYCLLFRCLMEMGFIACIAYSIVVAYFTRKFCILSQILLDNIRLKTSMTFGHISHVLITSLMLALEGMNVPVPCTIMLFT